MHATSAPLDDLAKCIRRALGNTPYEEVEKRKMLYLNLAGVLGTIGDLEGEIRQLRALCKETHGTASNHNYKLMLLVRVMNYTDEEEYLDEVLPILLQLRQEKLPFCDPMFGAAGGVAVMKQKASSLSYAYHMMGKKEEEMGDSLEEGSEERADKYAIAREYFDKAFVADPSECACFDNLSRIRTKLDPNLKVLTSGGENTMVMALGPSTIKLPTVEELTERYIM